MNFWEKVDLIGASIVLFGCGGELWMLLNKLPEHNERRDSLKGCWRILNWFESHSRIIGLRLKIIRPRKFSALKEHLLEGVFISLVAMGVGMELSSLPFSIKSASELNDKAQSAIERSKQVETTNAILTLQAEGLVSNNLVLRTNVAALELKVIQVKRAAGPRRLSDSEKTNLLNAIATLPKSSFHFQSDPMADQNEANGITDDIGNILVRDGWKFEGNFGAGSMSISPSGGPPNGIGIGAQTAELANALVGTLTNVGLAAYVGSCPPHEPGPVASEIKGVLIFIGRKPIPDFK